MMSLGEGNKKLTCQIVALTFVFLCPRDFSLNLRNFLQDPHFGEINRSHSVLYTLKS